MQMIHCWLIESSKKFFFNLINRSIARARNFLNFQTFNLQNFLDFYFFDVSNLLIFSSFSNSQKRVVDKILNVIFN